MLFEVLPGDVTLVVVAQQHGPIGDRDLVPTGLSCPPVHDPGPPACASEGVRPGIDRTLQQLMHRVVGGRTPLDLPCIAVAPHHR